MSKLGAPENMEIETVQAWPKGTPLELLQTSEGLEYARSECEALDGLAYGPDGLASCDPRRSRTTPHAG